MNKDGDFLHLYFFISDSFRYYISDTSVYIFKEVFLWKQIVVMKEGYSEQNVELWSIKIILKKIYLYRS